MRILKREASAALAELEEKLAAAREAGRDDPYARAIVYCSKLALGYRWRTYRNRHEHLSKWTRDACRRRSRILDEVASGKRQALAVPPVMGTADLDRLKRKGWYWVDRKGRAQLIMSVHTPPPEELADFFVPWGWSTWVSGVGASRYDFRSSPIWEAYNKYPETHRVYGGGWCGHIIKDKWSMGGDPGECVICLESPKTREAVAGYIRKHLPRAMKKAGRLISLLDYEYFYVCYCDYTKKMFREHLRKKHRRIAALNSAWVTKYKSFDEVQLPPMTRGDSNERKGRSNPGQVYDFYDFNLHRFTDYMKWAKSVQRKIDKDCAMATCAPHYNFVANFGESGSDVELMAREVNDILLNESGPSTKYVDFLRSATPRPKPIMDVESSQLTNTMANFLHGQSACSIYWGWSSDSSKGGGGARIPYGRKGSAPPIEDAERILRTSLDVRRLGPEITELATRVKRPVAVLYSRASLLQVPKHTGNKTAYLMELGTVYDALLECGRGVDFVTTTGVLEGKLRRYELLVVPAACYEAAAVYRKIMAFAAKGGRVFLTPNSFFFDEYARPKPEYLGSLGIEIERMTSPVLKAGAARTGIQRDEAGDGTEAPFLQGLIIDTVRSKVPRSALVPARGSFVAKGDQLKGAGVRHWLKEAPKGAEVLAKFPMGELALMAIKKGRGTVYYLATPLERPSYARAFRSLLDEMGCEAALRVTSPRGHHIDGLEFASLRRRDGTVLAYVNNLARRGRMLKLSCDRPIKSVRNLSLGGLVKQRSRLPALECWLLEIETE